MAAFDKALAYTLKHEGGWSDDPADPGGATNYGITLKTAQRFGIKTKEELRRIAPEKVAEIYEAGYWRFGDVNDQRVATKLFDMAVNMGPAAAVKLARRVLFCSPGAGPEPHSGVAPDLLMSLNVADPGDALRALCAASEAHYRAIVAKRLASAKFLKGWLRRANEVPGAGPAVGSLPNA
jgi:type VI secretion system secreted protein VgrG